MSAPTYDERDTTLEAARAEGRKEAGRAFVQWAMKNEIAEPPLDWAWFGEIVRWSGASLADDE